MKRIIILSCCMFTLLCLSYANCIEPTKDETEQPKKEIIFDEDFDEPVAEETTTEKAIPPRDSKFIQRHNREKVLVQGGGSDKTEWSVLLSLRWLKKHQNEDGSWGEDPYKPMLTGLALLTFLGHLEDHLSEEFGYPIRMGIDWLITHQGEDGYFAKEQRALQHAIVTYALAEMYAMTKLENLLPIVEKATKIIIAGQIKDGGWNYDYAAEEDEKESNILPITGWQIQALKAAQTAGIKFADGSMEKAMALATEYTQEKYNPETQAFGDKDKTGTWEDNYVTTPEGVLCMQLLGMYNSKEVKGALEEMRKNYKFDWKETTGGKQKTPLYAWFYATQAFFHATDKLSTNPYWRYWNPQLQNTLLKYQNKDGSFPIPPKSEENKLLGDENTKIYSTAICCLMLETYYRYSPRDRALLTFDTKRQAEDSKLIEK
jgi:hypothetical protein